MSDRAVSSYLSNPCADPNCDNEVTRNTHGRPRIYCDPCRYARRKATTPDACLCNHPAGSHRNGTGPCDDTWAFGVVCVCTRYRSIKQIHEARKEEAFWRQVGRHE